MQSGTNCSRFCSSGNFVGLIGVGILEVFHVAAKGSGSDFIPVCHDQFCGNGGRIRDQLPARNGMITIDLALLSFGYQIPAQGITYLSLNRFEIP